MLQQIYPKVKHTFAPRRNVTTARRDVDITRSDIN